MNCVTTSYSAMLPPLRISPCDTMFNDTLLDSVETAVHKLPEPVLDTVFFFHDIRVTCRTNHPAILAILTEMLGMFPEPAKLHAEVTYAVMCYESSSDFPLKLPGSRIHTNAVRL